MSEHCCDECGRTFVSHFAVASHVGRAHRAGKSRPDHVQRLFRAGVALPLRRRDGETLPCDGLTDLFFPDPVWRASYARKTAAAISLCQGCDRRDECLDGAMQRQEPFGVWGGVDLATLFAPHLRRPARAS